MKDIRPNFTDEEYALLKGEADRLGVSLKQLVRDRALGSDTENSPLNSVKVLSDEISKIREAINEIIRREITTGERLYEDNIIRLEMSMKELEGIVTAFIGAVLRQVKRNGNTDI